MSPDQQNKIHLNIDVQYQNIDSARRQLIKRRKKINETHYKKKHVDKLSDKILKKNKPIEKS